MAVLCGGASCYRYRERRDRRIRAAERLRSMKIGLWRRPSRPPDPCAVARREWREVCRLASHMGHAHMKRVRAVVALGFTLGTGAAAFQQATFKGAVRTVAIYATVKEPGGGLVPDLTRDDFQVDDNGRPQTITVFANDIQ